MDREKAIDLLDNLIGMVEDNQESDYDTALKMGIQALSQEPILDKLTEIIEPLRHLAFDEMSDVERQILQVIDKYAEQEPTVQDKQAESEKYQKAFDDGYANGYEQARFDYKQEPCTDAVSREDAIKAQCEACDICGNMRYTKCQYFMQGCNEVKCLRDLPSVNPQPCDDAISREELLKAIDTWDKFGYTETGCFVRITKEIDNYVPYVHLEDVITAIQKLPSVTQKSGKCEVKEDKEEQLKKLKAELDYAKFRCTL